MFNRELNAEKNAKELIIEEMKKKFLKSLRDEVLKETLTIKQEIKKLKETVENLEMQNENLKEMVEQLETQNENLKETVESLKTENKTLQENVNTLNDKVQCLEEENQLRKDIIFVADVFLYNARKCNYKIEYKGIKKLLNKR